MNIKISGSWLLMTLQLPHIMPALFPKLLQPQHSLVQNALSVERMSTGNEIEITQLPLYSLSLPVSVLKRYHWGKECKFKYDKDGKLLPPLNSLWNSPHVHWVSNMLEKSQPKLSIKIDNKNFKYIIDTRADKPFLRKIKVHPHRTLLLGPS